MSENARAASQTTTWSDILLAQPGGKSARRFKFQLLLVVAWHWTVLPATLAAVDWLLGYGASVSGVAVQPTEFDIARALEFFVEPLLAVSLLTTLLIEGLIGWGIFRLRTWRYGAHFPEFVRYWWRTCLWGTALVPITWLSFALQTRDYDVAMNIPLLWILCAIALPTLFVNDTLRRLPRDGTCSYCGCDLSRNLSEHCPQCGRGVLRLPPRRRRWNPACPECGYLLRGVRESRCPECGVDYPSKSAGFRRWAFRRLAWERLQRGGAVLAYCKSMIRIVATPRVAAWGLAIPGRWGRCARWSAIHLIITVVAAVLLANDQQCARWIAHRIWPPTFQPPHLFGFGDPPLDRQLVWAGQSLLGWTLPLLCAAGLACLISFLTPRRHPAAKLGGVKWSLYLVGLLPWPLLGWYVYYFVFPVQRSAVMPVAFTFRVPPPEAPLWLLITPYGLWWALGVAANPYNRVRGWPATLGYAAAYFGAWLLLVRVLFAPGPLEALR